MFAVVSAFFLGRPASFGGQGLPWSQATRQLSYIADCTPAICRTTKFASEVMSVKDAAPSTVRNGDGLFRRV